MYLFFKPVSARGPVAVIPLQFRFGIFMAISVKGWALVRKGNLHCGTRG